MGAGGTQAEGQPTGSRRLVLSPAAPPPPTRGVQQHVHVAVAVRLGLHLKPAVLLQQRQVGIVVCMEHSTVRHSTAPRSCSVTRKMQSSIRSQSSWPRHAQQSTACCRQQRSWSSGSRGGGSRGGGSRGAAPARHATFSCLMSVTWPGAAPQ